MDGNCYYWQRDGVYQYQIGDGTSRRLFTIAPETVIARLWVRDGCLYAVENRANADSDTDYAIYCYDCNTDSLSTFDWLSEYAVEGVRLWFYGVVEDEMLVCVQQQEKTFCFWLNIQTGSRRACDIQGGVYGYRKNCIALYQSGWDAIVLQDVQTGREQALSLPKEVWAAPQQTDYTLLAVGEKDCFWLKGQSIYRQRGEKLEEVFAYYGRTLTETLPFFQLIGDVYYFAFYGTPEEAYDITNLISPGEPPQYSSRISYCALTPDGRIYLLAQEFFDSAWIDYS